MLFFSATLYTVLPLSNYYSIFKAEANENALVPVYIKKLRKVLLENLQWIRAMKKDPTFKKVMETQKELEDTEGFDWLESTELAIDERKNLLNRLIRKAGPFHKIKTSPIVNVLEFFFLDLCIVLFQ